MTRTAQRVLLSYPADLSDWGRRTIEGEPFAAYLRRVHDAATAGDVWAEFVGVGCCGDTRDVPLRVERVEPAPAERDQADPDQTDVDQTVADESVRVDEDTTFAFEPRDDADGGGGWSVQSRAGP